MRTALGLVLALLLVSVLLWRQIRKQRALSQERARFLDDCLDLFERPTLRQSGAEFPRLVGFVRGSEIQVTPLIDTLAVRKLPSLWLLVTLASKTPLRGVFDLMMRPAGTEGFSNFHLLPEGVALPPGWPERAVIRTDNAAGLPPASVLDRHMGVFDNPRVKELLISQSGVRLVVQAAEAERAYYLIYRQAVFSIERLDRELLCGLIDRLFAIHEDLATWRSPRP